MRGSPVMRAVLVPANRSKLVGVEVGGDWKMIPVILVGIRRV